MDPEMDAAATKIQAGYRGMQARRAVSEIKSGKTEVEIHNEDNAGLQSDKDDVVDIDLEDADVVKAAEALAGSSGEP